jgi:hypothetical protein
VSAKTPAEQQLEFLKRLKEQQKQGRGKGGNAQATAFAKAHTASAEPAQGPASRGAGSGGAAEGMLRLAKARKTRGGRNIPLSAKAWDALREQALKPGVLKLNQDLGDWAVELLLKLPSELRGLPEAAKADLFFKIRTWLQERGGL